jgi:hypothetical protein
MEALRAMHFTQLALYQWPELRADARFPRLHLGRYLLSETIAPPYR